MTEAERKLETARFQDLIRRAQKSSRPVFSDFMDPDAQERLCAYAAHEGLECGKFGGSSDFERAVVGIWQFGCEPENSPIELIALKWNSRFASLTHRDILGAYLSLGFERTTLGDIRVEGDCAYLALLPSVAHYVLDNLESVGRTSVKGSVYYGQMPPAEKGAVSAVNIPSLRMDAVLAQTLHLSRAKAQTIIKGGLVRLNWQENDHTDAELKEGDVISIRGHGRIVIRQVTGESRKGRLFIEVETFLKP